MQLLGGLQQNDPEKLLSLAKANETNAAVMGLAPAAAARATRQARRLYVGNLPLTATEADLFRFMNEAVRKALLEPQLADPVASVYLKMEKRFAFVEFLSLEMATACLCLDQLPWNNFNLVVRRPSDYNPALFTQMGPLPKIDPSRLGLINTVMINDTPAKIAITGLALALRDDHVKEFLSVFGSLRALVRERDPNNGLPTGKIFAEYLDPSVTDEACLVSRDLDLELTFLQALSGIEIGGSKVQLEKWDPAKPLPAVPAIDTEIITQTLKNATLHPPSPVVCLMDMVTREELLDDAEYQDIKEDIYEEASKYGKVVSLDIPKPSLGGESVPGEGLVFIEFDCIESATKAHDALQGRRFGPHTVLAQYFSPERYQMQDY